ncbi:MAG: phosphate uptake regulator PhoU [Fervidobacterium sp.]|uniref:Phosphate uptake regulator, PhoU n=1 Tax=Fervidobacterium gondwanense DSM 13020 TaxID=1121883 RepID=A0A1M7SFS3_FERGO|nr:phosphate uptake regulator PhoU [Fervidobacterium gondwanense]UXF01126.1 PhoU family transcriptional regulator [Fervidobacterium riparium]SHN57305.1 phosphate uptake regulator, PhoU [Fervidobacterium gondwanense DSM 13020]
MKWLMREELEELKKLVMKQGWYVEDLLHNCSEAFKERDANLAREIEQNYWDVYKNYLDILEFSQLIYGMFSPDRRDLRFISGSVVISKILLDVADRIRDISDDIVKLTKEPDINQSIALPDMFKFAQRMLRKSLRIYVDQNLEGAPAVCSQDALMDESHERFSDDVIKLIQDNPRIIRRGLTLMDISRALEEISDYSVQIIETTHYIMTAKYYTCYRDELREFSIDMFKKF